MITRLLTLTCLALLPLAMLLALGCDVPAKKTEKKTETPGTASPTAEAKKTVTAVPTAAAKKTIPAAPTAGAKMVEVGDNVFLEILGDKRRVVISAYVCLRQGQLEQLMCRKQTKEHEAILAADVDAMAIHKALLVTGAEAGSPVKYQPKFEAPRGTTIKVTLQYQRDGKTITVPAQKWVRNVKTRKDLHYDWVFAGSILLEDPLDKTRPPFYAANSGDVICVSNFDTALLDLPINSSQDNAELAFEANTEVIPPLETAVQVILEPVLKSKKK